MPLFFYFSPLTPSADIYICRYACCTRRVRSALNVVLTTTLYFSLDDPSGGISLNGVCYRHASLNLTVPICFILILYCNTGFLISLASSRLRF